MKKFSDTLFFDVSSKIKKPSITENEINLQDKKQWKKILGNSFCFGDGLKKALCGIPSSFNVFFALGTGEQISSKIFKKNNMLTVTLEPLYIEVQVNIDKKTDTLVVTFTLPKLRAGRYLINVTFLGEHMRGSPFNLVAKNGFFYFLFLFLFFIYFLFLFLFFIFIFCFIFFYFHFIYYFYFIFCFIFYFFFIFILFLFLCLSFNFIFNLILKLKFFFF